MSYFKSRFDFVLEADTNPAPAPAPETQPANDQEAMAQTLDTAQPSDFDVKAAERQQRVDHVKVCLLYTSPSPRDRTRSRMPSSA